MNKKKHLKILNEFANKNNLANGNIDITITPCGKSFKPRYGTANYEDVMLLANIIQGAEYFLFWLARNGYDVRKKRGK